MAPRSKSATQSRESVAKAPTPDAAPANSGGENVASDETRSRAPGYIDASGERGKNTTPFVRPDLQGCPKCGIGLLYPTTWDENALHEKDQPVYSPNMLSGGSVSVTCFNCGHGETHALNPTEAPVNPRSGA